MTWPLLLVCKSEGQDFKKAKERTWDSASLHRELYIGFRKAKLKRTVRV
jgi:hypothetical protein